MRLGKENDSGEVREPPFGYGNRSHIDLPRWDRVGTSGAYMSRETDLVNRGRRGADQGRWGVQSRTRGGVPRAGWVRKVA